MHRIGKSILIPIILAIEALSQFPRADDGTIDINIDPATGYTISTSGSYRLVKNVTMTANVAAIYIIANNVTLDLGGHTVTAFSTSNENGIIGNTKEGVTVKGGRVTGFGGRGVFLGPRAIVLNFDSHQNNKAGDSPGIQVGDNSTVTECRVTNNNPTTTGDTYGIQTGAFSIVSGNVVSGNSVSASSYNYFGINCKNGTIIRNNVCTGGSASGSGIAIGINCVSFCTVTSNIVSGVEVTHS